jgi:hypothetical protein
MVRTWKAAGKSANSAVSLLEDTIYQQAELAKPVMSLCNLKE